MGKFAMVMESKKNLQKWIHRKVDLNSLLHSMGLQSRTWLSHWTTTTTKEWWFIEELLSMVGYTQNWYILFKSNSLKGNGFFYHQLFEEPWTNQYWTSLSLSFLVGKMEITPTSHIAKWNDMVTVKSLTLSTVSGKSHMFALFPSILIKFKFLAQSRFQNVPFSLP